MRNFKGFSEKDSSGWLALPRREFLKAGAALLAGCAIGGVAREGWAAEEGRKMLIIYFSHTGHTKTVAEEIHNFTGAPMVEILPETPFPTDHAKLVSLAEKQAAEGFWPAFTADLPKDMQVYDVIFLGFPIWAYTMPMIIYSFLDKHHFQGKSIAPFSTHAGSGIADAPEQIARLCPEAKILPGLAVRGTRAAESAAEVRTWLVKLGFLK